MSNGNRAPKNFKKLCYFQFSIRNLLVFCNLRAHLNWVIFVLSESSEERKKVSLTLLCANPQKGAQCMNRND